MASILARVLEALRRFGGRPTASWVRPSNAVTRWLNGTIELPDDSADTPERAMAQAPRKTDDRADSGRASTSDAA